MHLKRAQITIYTTLIIINTIYNRNLYVKSQAMEVPRSSEVDAKLTKDVNRMEELLQKSGFIKAMNQGDPIKQSIISHPTQDITSQQQDVNQEAPGSSVKDRVAQLEKARGETNAIKSGSSGFVKN